MEGKAICFKLTKGKTDIKTKMGCWFCLDNPEADRSLVAFENELVYLALDKGPIDNFHFLLVPQNHTPCSLQLTSEEKAEFTRVEGKLREFYESEKRAYIKYERYFRLSEGVSHMIVQFISIPYDKYGTLELLFLSCVKDTKMEFFELGAGESVADVVKPGEYYISLNFFNCYDNKQKNMVCILSEALMAKLPWDFMRQFICRIIDKPDKANWKSCVREPEQVDFLIQRLKKFFQGF